MAVIGKINSVTNVTASVKYARDGLDRQTKELKCVGSDGYGINPDYAEWQIKATAKAYGKQRGVEGYSMVTSFKEGEISPKNALIVVKEAWKRTTREMNGDFPCAFYVHGNTKNIHVHAVAGAIDPQTGVKLHQKRMWELLAEKTNEVCKEVGLSVIADRAEKRQDRFEYHLNKQGAYSWKSELKEVIEQALTSSVRSSENFIANLQALGVQVKHRTRQGEPIYLYEFVGQDGKTHKAKDYKLGGTAYERQHLLEKIQEVVRSTSDEQEKLEAFSAFFKSARESHLQQKAYEKAMREQEREQRRERQRRDLGGLER